MENEFNESVDSDFSEEVITDDIDTEEVDTPTEEDIEAEEKPEEKPKQTREEKYAKALAIAKRYAPKEQKQAKTPETGDTDVSSLELGRVYNRIDSSKLPPELSESAMERVQKLAKLDDISLIEAYNSDLYQAWEGKEVKKYKTEKSQLRTSRGGKVEVKKSLDSPDLSEADHKALWKEATQ